ncbi:MAG: hypothetical protein ACLTYW_00110 [Collinsella sp.]
MHKATGCKIDTLSFSFEGNAPLDIGITAAGIDAALFGGWSGETEPSCFDGYFIPTNGVFKFSPTTRPHRGAGDQGEFELSNSLTSYRGAGA